MPVSRGKLFIIVLFSLLINSIVLNLSAEERKKIRVGEALLKTGMKKSLVRKKTDYASKSFPPSSDKWRIKSVRGKKETFLFFNKDKLSGWEYTLYRDEFISRSFPLNHRHLKKGASLDEVENKWGRPDKEYEINHKGIYGLYYTYYVRAPDINDAPLKLQNSVVTEVLKKGKVIVIYSSDGEHIESFSLKKGELRQGLIKNLVR